MGYAQRRHELYSLSIPILLLWIPISIILIFIAIRLILYHILIDDHHSMYELIHSSTNSALHHISKKNRMIALLLIIFIFPFSFLCTSLLPNVWMHFDMNTIQKSTS